jgi:hypothetical protein
MGHALLLFLGWTAFGTAIITGLLLDLVGLFGNWVILVAIVGLWLATGLTHFGLMGLLVMLALAIIGEVLEFALAGYGARRFGGSKGSMVAALVGCLAGAVLGTPWFPIVGTLLGACLGAFGGAALYEYLQHEKTAGESFRTGFGAALGKIGGLFAKFLCGLAILFAAALTY